MDLSIGASCLVVCNTSPKTRHNFFWFLVIILNFCFKEFRFGLHAKSIVLVDFLYVLGSIEGRFISASNAFEQTLDPFCRNYSFVNPPWDVRCLCVFGMRWCMFVNKFLQGSVILFAESIGFLGRIIHRLVHKQGDLFSFSLYQFYGIYER